MEMLIYKITNVITGKIYIGQTQKTMSQRWVQHQCQVRYVGQRGNRKICRYLHNSMKKHGVDNFTIEEIDGANSEEELNYREWLWIYRLNCLAPHGYNLRVGGDRRSVSQSTRELLSETSSGSKNGMYGKKGSQKQREWLIQYNKTKKITEESIQKMRDAQQLRVRLGLNKGFTRKKTPEEIEKVATKLRKKFILTSPDGMVFKVNNIRLFAKEKELCSRALRKNAQKKPHVRHRGWLCVRDVTNV